MERPLKARIGISLFFFTNGFIFSNLVPRLPQLKTSLALSDAHYGLFVMAMPIGALLAVGVAANLIRRFNALRIGIIFTFTSALMMAAVGFVPVIWLILLALVLAGFSDAIVDAAQNVHALKVEDRVKKSIINSLHAVWSLGAGAGAITGAAAAAIELPLGIHLAISGLIGFGLAIFSAELAKLEPSLSFSDKTDQNSAQISVQNQHPIRKPWIRLVLLGVMAIVGVSVEDIGSNWSVLYLWRDVGASIGIAGLGYAVIICAQFIGRIVGDSLIDRFGQYRVDLIGGLMVVTGAGLIIGLPFTPTVIVGYALAGLGCSTSIPGAYAAAGRLEGFREGTGIVVASWMLRIGMLVTSPLVGMVSTHTSLRLAMSALAIAGILISLLARLTRTRPSLD